MRPANGNVDGCRAAEIDVCRRRRTTEAAPVVPSPAANVTVGQQTAEVPVAAFDLAHIRAAEIDVGCERRSTELPLPVVSPATALVRREYHAGGVRASCHLFHGQAAEVNRRGES